MRYPVNKNTLKFNHKNIVSKNTDINDIILKYLILPCLILTWNKIQTLLYFIFYTILYLL